MARKKLYINNKEKSKDDFKRKKQIKEQVKSVLIACEDKISSPNYFKMIIKKLIGDKKITQDSLVIAKHEHVNPIQMIVLRFGICYILFIEIRL